MNRHQFKEVVKSLPKEQRLALLYLHEEVLECASLRANINEVEKESVLSKVGEIEKRLTSFMGETNRRIEQMKEDRAKDHAEIKTENAHILAQTKEIAENLKQKVLSK